MAEAVRQELSIRDYGAILWRRKWIVAAMVLLVPICAVLIAKQHKPSYEATATVATREGNLAATVSGIPDYSYIADPTRIATTQITLAETPAVASAVLKRAHITGMSPYELLGATTIQPSPAADILFFTVHTTSPHAAVALANAYAKQYTVFRSNYDTQTYHQAADSIAARAAQLKAEGQGKAAAALSDKVSQLETLAELQTGNAVLANQAAGAAKIAKDIKKEGLIGLGLGIVLGLGLAFLRDAFDTRVRGPEDVTRRTGLPLLARIPPPPRKLQRTDDLVMIEEPTSVEAETFRMLRTNVEFASVDTRLRSIMVTSALEKEGKSTTIANLAVAQARSGKRVVLVDLDLRRPRLDKFFKLPIQPGLTNVVLGHATLDEVTAHIPLGPQANGKHNGNGNGNGHGAEHMPIEGLLDVIPSGTIPPDPGEFVSATSLTRLLETLESKYDLVMVDTPPLLRVGDALTLAPKMSAVIVVTRIPGAKRSIISELKRQIDTLPIPTLGFVVTGNASGEGYHAGYYYEYRSRPGTGAKLIPRGELEVPVLPPRRGAE